MLNLFLLFHRGPPGEKAWKFRARAVETLPLSSTVLALPRHPKQPNTITNHGEIFYFQETTTTTTTTTIKVVCCHPSSSRRSFPRSRLDLGCWIASTPSTRKGSGTSFADFLVEVNANSTLSNAPPLPSLLPRSCQVCNC